MAALSIRREAVAPKAPGMPSREIQELWFATRRREWKSLCVIPAAPGESTLAIANALAEVGQMFRRSPLRVIKTAGMDLGSIAELVMEMTEDAPAGAPVSTVWTSGAPRVVTPQPPISQTAPVIIAIESVIENPLVLPVALAAECVLLCVRLGETDLPSARHTIQVIGRERLIGCVVIR